ncbi:MAG: M23 family metallopeptidase [Cyanobacteria bacterium SZAS LIN-2]|nr:M23 family metallopeptidase [Cyanobacteria bacterium SZAS LIN-3]MBS1998020.1 M23 family metallopeptidase [Cyanobacteria bacterium SZAS LIN-2]
MNQTLKLWIWKNAAAALFCCLICGHLLSAWAVAPDKVVLTRAESLSAIQELRAKNLVFPIAGIAPESVKGQFDELRGENLHHAIDIAAPRNTPVLAAGDGKIARLWLSKAGGNTIYEIDPSGRYAYYYAHLEHYVPTLKDGDTVTKGQVIGYVGTSGDAPPNSPHLHFSFSKLTTPGVWWPGGYIDPYEVFKPQ